MPEKQNRKYCHSNSRNNHGNAQNITHTREPENFSAQGESSHAVYPFPVFFTHEAPPLLFGFIAHFSIPSKFFLFRLCTIQH
jgi:hypothetical protein